MICLDSCRHFVFRHMLCILFVCLVQVFAYNVVASLGCAVCIRLLVWLGCCEGSALQVHLLSRAAKRGRDIVIGVCVRVCVCMLWPITILSHVSLRVNNF